MESVDGRSVSWRGHLVLVHYGERHRRASVAAWVRQGLDLGAKILYIEPAHESAERSLMGLLEEQRVDSDAAVHRGQLQVFAAADDVYSPTWQAGVTEEALGEGYPWVWWSGEAETAWSVMSPSAHADIEWATDQLSRAHPLSILCQYPARLPPATLQTVCAMHRGGVRDSLMQISPCPGGVALTGEIDASNEKVTHSALMAATSAARRDRFIVDLSCLGFIDVAGTRSIMTGTSAYRTRGAQVLLRAASPAVDKVLRLLGVHRAERVRME